MGRVSGVGTPRPTGRAARRTAVLAAVAGMLASSAVASGAPRQDDPVGFDELAVGDWFGNGRATGETIGFDESSGGAVSGTGEFTTNMEFGVDIDGSLTGTWDLFGTSEWQIATPAVAIVATMSHTSSGPMAGNARTFSLGTAQIASTIAITDSDFPGVAGSTFDSSDPIGPLDLRVDGIYCNDAWGEWIVSWNMELAEQSYTPTFEGDWHAVRQSGEFTFPDGTGLDEFSNFMRQLSDDVNDIFGNAPAVDGWLVVPADVTWEIIHRVVDNYNALRNLTPCDRVVVGDDQIEQWMYAITLRVGLLINNLVGTYELDASSLTELVNIATAVGAIGGGSAVGGFEGLDQILEAALREIADDPDADPEEARRATIALWQNGWSG